MDNKIVSVIVSVYNVEKYLKECVDSIINQTYKNLEILLIDDGSSDKSGLICDEFCKKDDRIRVFHKENGGLSDARNFGIENSNGQFIMFVDSDDILSNKIVSVLIKNINETNSDVSVCNLSHFKDGEMPEYIDKKKISKFSGQDALEDFLYQRCISTSSCAKLYKRECICDIKFVKDQRFEDNEFLFKLFSNVKNVSYVNAKLYGYRHREKSITTGSFNEKDFDIIEIGNKILSECSNNYLRNAAISYQFANAMRIYLTVSDDYLNDSRFLYCKEFLKKNVLVVLKDKKIRKKQKIAALLYKLKCPREVLKQIRNKKNRW